MNERTGRESAHVEMWICIWMCKKRSEVLQCGTSRRQRRREAAYASARARPPRPWRRGGSRSDAGRGRGLGACALSVDTGSDDDAIRSDTRSVEPCTLRCANPLLPAHTGGEGVGRAAATRATRTRPHWTWRRMCASSTGFPTSSRAGCASSPPRSAWLYAWKRRS